MTWQEVGNVLEIELFFGAFFFFFQRTGTPHVCQRIVPRKNIPDSVFGTADVKPLMNPLYIQSALSNQVF